MEDDDEFLWIKSILEDKRWRIKLHSATLVAIGQ